VPGVDTGAFATLWRVLAQALRADRLDELWTAALVKDLDFPELPVFDNRGARLIGSRHVLHHLRLLQLDGLRKYLVDLLGGVVCLLRG